MQKRELNYKWGFVMKKAKWFLKLKAPDHCPNCGIEISAKQKRKISVSRFSYYKFKCPGCQKRLYLKGGWLLSVYTVIWILVILISGLIIFRGNYVAQRLSGLIIIVLACEGATWFIVPFLPIKVKEEE